MWCVWCVCVHMCVVSVAHMCVCVYDVCVCVCVVYACVVCLCNTDRKHLGDPYQHVQDLAADYLSDPKIRTTYSFHLAISPTHKTGEGT